MNWITKIIKAGERIKTAIHKRASKDDIAKSDWTSCCKGPILKKNLEKNLWVCPSCNKHHRINCRQRFDIIFGKNNYEILKTPIPQDDPLNWKDSKSYKERLKIARKRTGQECAVMIVKTKINNIKMYELARKDIFIRAKPINVCIQNIKILDFCNNILTLDIKCSKGTYIRSLARDIAYSLDTYGYLSNLARTSVGDFNEKNSIKFNDLEKCMFID